MLRKISRIQQLPRSAGIAVTNRNLPLPIIALSFFLGILSYHFIIQQIWLMFVVLGLGLASSLAKYQQTLGQTLLGQTPNLFKLWLIFLSGIFWIFAYITWQNLWTLPDALESVPLITTGYVASLPEKEASRTRFLFETDHFEKPSHYFPHNGLIRCTWENAPPIGVGEAWRLHIKLKKPHSPLNPGGFDYEAWLFSHKIHATGTIVPHSINTKMGTSFFSYRIDQLRQYLAAQIETVLFQSRTKGLMKALIIGDQSSILESQWTVLRKTGTNHLFAIAGLHIGFIAHLVYHVTTWHIKRKALHLRAPAQLIGSVSALAVALLYSALAGFSLPTKRAIIMLAIFLIAKIRRCHINAWHSWSLALTLLMIINPLQILTESFWLSFTAVGSLIYGFQGRVATHRKFMSKVMHGIRTQWITSVALIPLSLLLFQQASLVGFFANFIAIPWIGFLVAPIALAGGIFILAFPPLGNALVNIADFLLRHFWPILETIGSGSNSQWYQVISTPWILLSGSIAILLLLAPKGFPSRFLAIFLILPLLFYTQKKPNFGDVDFTLLDVGQGLSSVVRTRDHTLVFDTGARYKNFFDSGESIILPFLRFLHVDHIDTLMISHGDNDHIGGANSLLRNLPVHRIITSVPERFNYFPVITCATGQHWRWDGVDFEVLYPALGTLFKGNNRSCVLKITTKTHGLLLTGDIEKEAENILLNTQLKKLTADVLVAPHHGSKTSSTEAFIQAVSPQIALFPVGYKNQYHLPSPLIVNRYHAMGVKTYDSVHCGAIQMTLSIAKHFPIHCYREEHKSIVI